MPLQYSINARPNPSEPESEPRFYATAKSARVIEVRDLCKFCRAHSTFTMGDTMGAIETILEHAIEQLQLGNIVRLGGLGSFRLTINDQIGAPSLEKFTDANIKGCHVLFTEGSDLTDMCNNMSYECLTPKKKESDEENGEEVKP